MNWFLPLWIGFFHYELVLHSYFQEVKIAGFRPTELKDIPALHTLLSEVRFFFLLYAPFFCFFCVNGDDLWWSWGRSVMIIVTGFFVYSTWKSSKLPRNSPGKKSSTIFCHGTRWSTLMSLRTNRAAHLTDFVSFYSLPSTVVKHDKHESIYAAYSFYNVATKSSWRDLLMASLVMAQKVQFCSKIAAFSAISSPSYTKEGIWSGPAIFQKVLYARIRSLSGTLMRHRDLHTSIAHSHMP